MTRSGPASDPPSGGSAGTVRATRAFEAVLNAIGRDGLTDVLLNWNESALSEDGNRILAYPGRDRQYSRGAAEKALARGG